MPVLNFPQQSDTRWVCKQKAVTLFKTRFDYVVLALKHFANTSIKGKERVEARDLLHQINTFDFVFVLYLLDLVLPHISSASLCMQSKSADIGTTTVIIESTVNILQEMRKDESHSQLFLEVSDFCRDRLILKPTEEPENLFRGQGKLQVL
jgi:hypothetical protein